MRITKIYGEQSLLRYCVVRGWEQETGVRKSGLHSRLNGTATFLGSGDGHCVGLGQYSLKTT